MGTSIDASLLAEIKSMIQDIKEIKETVTTTASKINTLSTKVENIETENAVLKVKIEALTIQNQTLNSVVNELHQYSRKNNVIINGVPVTENEDMRKVANEVASALNVTLQEYDICAVHRLPSRPDKIPAIVLRLNTGDIKNLI